MTVSEWIDQTRQRLEHDRTSVLYDSELEKLKAWQRTGWIANNYKEALAIADIQIAFANMLLNHALAISEMREEMVIVIHKMQGEQ